MSSSATKSFVLIVLVATLVTLAVGYEANKARNSADDARSIATHTRSLVIQVKQLQLEQVAARKRAAKQTAESDLSLCNEIEKSKSIQRRDKQRDRKIALSTLKAHPDGTPTFTRKVLLQALSDTGKTLKELSPLRCKLLPTVNQG